MINSKWDEIVSSLDFAFQPIVHVRSGKTYALEALLRNTKDIGFQSIFSCFDEAYHDGTLYQFDLALRRIAFKKFSLIDIDDIQLFYNLDNRLLYMPDFTYGNTIEIIKQLKLDKKRVCYELSERGTLQDPSAITNMVNRYKQEGFSVAIDDFGTGISGLQLLYYANANYIKLDRFFISQIESDSKKRLFCSSIIKMANAMGIKVIAEGVESSQEFYTCKDLGVDLIQGYFVQKPQIEIKKFKETYEHIGKMSKKDKRSNHGSTINKRDIECTEALSYNSTLNELLLYFKNNPDNTFVPIIDEYEYLYGVIYEKDIKKISYSQYGLALAKNDKSKDKIKIYIKNVISAELTLGIDKTLELYSMNDGNHLGVFITNENKYLGFIDVNTLLKISYLRNIEIAKDQNPLTKLPGNSPIEDFISRGLNKKKSHLYHFAYCDFDDFKPFNDTYGFRLGDRAIVMFADILKKYIDNSNLIGHIGGDDFFIGFLNVKYEEVYAKTLKIQNEFEKSIKSLYSAEDRQNGHISMSDRFGIKRDFNLLSVSVAVIEISKKIPINSFDMAIGEIKKSSKKVNYPLGVSIL
ncbi:MAG: GGDEF domain-containing protein [Campylobacterota bacterium]|nr:GGDEF domain-containing protein [Campylobacterota bacterium]